MVKETLMYFVAFYSMGGDTGIVKQEATSCLHAKTLVQESLPNEYIVLRDCVGRGERELNEMTLWVGEL